jgi:hypothetical protein
MIKAFMLSVMFVMCKLSNLTNLMGSANCQGED